MAGDGPRLTPFVFVNDPAQAFEQTHVQPVSPEGYKPQTHTVLGDRLSAINALQFRAEVELQNFINLTEGDQ